MTTNGKLKTVRASKKSSGGFNVICINDVGVNTPYHHRPHGCVKRGLIYRVLGKANRGQGYVILGKPTSFGGVEVGWWKWRFKRQGHKP